MSKESLAKKIAQITGQNWCLVAAVEAGIDEEIPLEVYHNPQRKEKLISERLIAVGNLTPETVNPLLDEIHNSPDEVVTVVGIRSTIAGHGQALNVEPDGDRWRISGDLEDGTTSVVTTRSRAWIKKHLEVEAPVPNFMLFRKRL